MGKTFSTGLLTNGIWQDASNNIGIGGSPSGSYKLEVTGTAKVSSTLLVSGASTFSSAITLSTASTSYGSVFSIANTSNSKQWNFTTVGSGIAGRTGNLEINNNVADIFAITQAGNVGIGTTSPSYLLDVNGMARILRNGGDEALRISNDNGYIGFFNTANSTRSGYIQGNTTSLQISSSLAIPIQFLTGDAEKMRITSGGNVGINNTTPSTYLDVSNNGTNNNAYITTRNTGINGYRSGAIFTNSAAGGLSWYLVSTNNGDGDWGGGKFAISTNNAVGVYLNGSTATTWTGQSDIRLKDIDSEIENAIDKVNKLRGVRFTWKSDETKKMQVGLIAQEVKEVLPEAVDFDETNEDYRMGVQYTDLIPLLVNAIKELSAQNQDLKSRLDKAGL